MGCTGGASSTTGSEAAERPLPHVERWYLANLAPIGRQDGLSMSVPRLGRNGAGSGWRPSASHEGRFCLETGVVFGAFLGAGYGMERRGQIVNRSAPREQPCDAKYHRALNGLHHAPRLGVPPISSKPIWRAIAGLRMRCNPRSRTPIEARFRTIISFSPTRPALPPGPDSTCGSA